MGEHARRATALADAAGDPDGRFRAFWNVWLHHVARYDTRASDTAVEKLLRIAEGGPADHVLQAHHAAWSACYLSGDQHALREHLAAGAALYDESQHERLMASYAGHDPGVCRLCYQARAELLDGNVELAFERIDEALALARRLDHRYGVAQAISVKTELLVRAGRTAEALACAEEATTYTRTHGFPFWGTFARFSQGVGKALLGQPEGLPELREVISNYPVEGVPPYLKAYEATACLALGCHSEGRDAVETALAAAEQSGEVLALVDLLILRARFALAENVPDVEAAMADLDHAMALAEAKGLRLLVQQAQQIQGEIPKGRPQRC